MNTQPLANVLARHWPKSNHYSWTILQSGDSHMVEVNVVNEVGFCVARFTVDPMKCHLGIRYHGVPDDFERELRIETNRYSTSDQSIDNQPELPDDSNLQVQHG